MIQFRNKKIVKKIHYEEQQHHLKHEQILTNKPMKQNEDITTTTIITIRVDVHTFLLQLNGLNQYVQDSKHIKQSLSFVPTSPLRYPPLESRILISALSSRNCRIPSSRHGITLRSFECFTLPFEAPYGWRMIVTWPL